MNPERRGQGGREEEEGSDSFLDGPGGTVKDYRVIEHEVGVK